MKLSKYQLNGAYHWSWFKTRFSYARHVGYLKSWVTEKNTLQIGAGDGLIAYELGILGIDSDPYAVDLAEIKGYPIDLGNTTNLPYKNKQFDAVLMTDALEYIGNTNKALNEARRVLKNYLYLTIPIAPDYAESDHIHYWEPDQLVKIVKRKGFKLVNNYVHSVSRLRIYFKFAKI